MEFTKKVIVPVVTVLLFGFFFSPLYMVDGQINYFYLWILIGIPFGVRQMCIWLIPRGHGISETVGIVALNFIVGGIIGGFVAIGRLLMAVGYCIQCLASIFRRA